jgi:hypothetical protein
MTRPVVAARWQLPTEGERMPSTARSLAADRIRVAGGGAVAAAVTEPVVVPDLPGQLFHVSTRDLPVPVRRDADGSRRLGRRLLR